MHPSTDLESRCTYVFQPVRRLSDGRIHHYEALVRPTAKDTSTESFICELETTGYVESLDRHSLSVLARVADSSPVPIAVNVSASAVTQRAFLGHTLSVLGTMSHPEAMHFEVTETRPIADLKIAYDFVRAVQALGCEVALDDYGTGYMTPSILLALRADLVKIDMSIVRGLFCEKTRDDNIAFLKRTMEMAKLGKAQVAAEGLEDEDMVQEVRALGIDLGQGYYLGRPSAWPLTRAEKVARFGGTTPGVTRIVPPKRASA